MDKTQKLTETIVYQRLRMALQKIYEEFPSTPDNRQALEDGALSVAVTCSLAAFLKPTVEDGMKVIDVTDKLKKVLEEEKQKLDTHESN